MFTPPALALVCIVALISAAAPGALLYTTAAQRSHFVDQFLVEQAFLLIVQFSCCAHAHALQLQLHVSLDLMATSPITTPVKILGR